MLYQNTVIRIVLIFAALSFLLTASANELVLSASPIGGGVKKLDANKSYTGITVGATYTFSFDVLNVNKPIDVSVGGSSIVVSTVGSYSLGFVASGSLAVANFFHQSGGAPARIVLDDIALKLAEEVVASNCVNVNDADYRFSFNGMEKDDEVKSGLGNSNTSYFRQYDTRLGRWLTIDPKRSAWESPYASMSNNPILYMDPNGDTIIWAGGEQNDKLKARVEELRAQSTAFDKLYLEMMNSEEIIHVSIDQQAMADRGYPTANGMFSTGRNEDGSSNVFFKNEDVNITTITEEFFHSYQILEVYGTSERTAGEIEAEANVFQVIVAAEAEVGSIPLQPGSFWYLMDESFLQTLSESEYMIPEGSDAFKLYKEYLGFTEQETFKDDKAYGGEQRELIPKAYNNMIDGLKLVDLKLPSYGFEVKSTPIEDGDE